MKNENEVLTSLSLLRRVGGPKDEDAWKKFFDLYQPLIFTWARCKFKNPDDAEDVTAIVLKKLVEALPQFEYDPQRRFRGWLWTVVENAVCDFQRRQRRRPGDCGSGDWQVQELLKCIPYLVEELDNEWEQKFRQLQRAIEHVQQRVEPHTWEAFELTILQSVPPKDVAEQLGISRASVYVAKARVILKLREELVRLQNEDPARHSERNGHEQLS